MKWFDNLKWSDWVYYIDGWIPKASLSMSFLGYLILFNDSTTDLIHFTNLTTKDEININLSDEINISLSDNVISLNDNVISPSDEININLSDNVISLNGNVISPSDNVISPSDNVISLSDGARLKMVYFAFLFLGVSNFWYRITRPYQFKFGTDFVQYAKNTFEIFIERKYVEIHTDLQQHGPNYKENPLPDWNNFRNDLIANSNHKGSDSNAGNWELTKNRYGNMLRGILQEYYSLSNTSCKRHLLFCIIFSSMGYALLLIPSGDLLIKVFCTIF